MRWFLAALAFALVVGLAVFTVAVKAENTRHRLQLDSRRVRTSDLYVALRHRALRTLQVETPERLAARLREVLARHRAGWM